MKFQDWDLGFGLVVFPEMMDSIRGPNLENRPQNVFFSFRGGVFFASNLRRSKVLRSTKCL